MNKIPAIEGGDKVRHNTLQYGKQTVEDDDIQAVVELLKENKFLTTGPKVDEFEEEVCKLHGMKYGVACSSGTAALHIACHSIGIGEGDEVIVPAISFVASANCVLYCGGVPVFCDVEEDTLNIDPDKLEKLITEKTKAVVTVDYAGQLCDYSRIKQITDKYNLLIIEDGAHSAGQKMYYGDVVTQSYHPVKHITTCEGGMVLTNNEQYYNSMKIFRTHGITKSFQQRTAHNQHHYDMVELGYNYRIPDLLCAMGISQIKKLDGWVVRRQEIAQMYDDKLSVVKNLVEPLTNKFNNVYHIYTVKFNISKLSVDRDYIFKALRCEGVGVNVHYMPIYLHPYYKQLGYEQGLCPVAEDVYSKIMTLPIFPTMTNDDVQDVINAVIKVVEYYK